MLEILTPIWHVKAEMRQRIRSVLEWAISMDRRNARAEPSRKTWMFRNEGGYHGRRISLSVRFRRAELPWRSSAFDKMYRATRWDRS